MTPLSGILLLALVNLGIFAWRLIRNMRSQDAEIARLEECRLGLAFIATGHTFPHDQCFAGALIHGNDATIRRQFPDYPAWRAAEIERRMEAEP